MTSISRTIMIEPQTYPRTLLEAFAATGRMPQLDEAKIEVHGIPVMVNPTAGMIFGEVKRLWQGRKSEARVRGLATPDNLYVWDAMLEDHYRMRLELEKVGEPVPPNRSPGLFHLYFVPNNSSYSLEIDPDFDIPLGPLIMMFSPSKRQLLTTYEPVWIVMNGLQRITERFPSHIGGIDDFTLANPNP